ncbi:MAG: Gfo/Idh/MocA family oxidoreductase [Candidatus Latescibacteria bacterium]|nr:Gfo/Idh/MocA family oxidoreductase [Candidatus Latescibacterota bacterium]
MSVRVGIIGVGVHGMHHARLLSDLGSAELSGIYDIDQSASSRVASEFGATAFNSLDELLLNVDCVTVAVPTSSHYDVVMRCLSQEKHVLVEKPIAESLAESEKMIEEAEKRGLIFSVGHLERFNSAYRSVMNTGLSPLFIESHRLAAFNPRGTDVAVVLDLMIHDIDIILDMVKQPIILVNAVGVSVVSDEVDIANARLEFEGGCVANLTASRISQKKMRKIRTFQKNSYVSMDFLAGESEVFTMNTDVPPPVIPNAVPQMMEGITYEKFSNDGLNALELELADFVRAVKDGAKPLISGVDGHKALEIASMVMKSMEVSMRRIE